MNNYKKSLETGMFPFFIKKYKVTYLLTFILAVSGVYSVFEIPKESSPTINIPSVSINTTYDGIDASTIDEEITERIENSLDNIEGISSTTSTSSEGKSSIRVEIDNTFDIDDVVGEIEDSVASVSMPSDADEPEVEQREFNSTNIFDTVLYSSEGKLSFEELLAKAETLQKSTEGRVGIREVSIDANTVFDIRLVINKETIDSLGITLDTISSAVSNNNLDKSLGSYKIGDKKYNFNFKGEIEEIKGYLDVVIISGSSQVKLGDIAELELYYGDEQINKFGKYDDFGYNYISLTYYKQAGDNIFDIAGKVKTLIKTELEKSYYEGIDFYYTNDLSADIIDDYGDLVQSAILTISIVFLVLIFFVGFREAAIATIVLPLAFLISFIVVYLQGETLNFMTNFAFVLSFGIAIDTIIIIVEGASEKMKEGFSKRHAVLIALREFKSPLIIGTLTTLAAFIPILSLPGMFGIMLAFIPNIVFITLISTLFVALFLTGALFIALNSDHKSYEKNVEKEKVRPKDEIELLEEDRIGKHLLGTKKIPLRDRLYLKYSSWYKKSLTFVLKSRWSRILTTISPIILLVVLVVTILPKVGFEVFPSGKNDKITMNITPPDGTKMEDITKHIKFIENTFSSLVEIDNYTLKITETNINGSLNLTSSAERMVTDLMDNTAVQEILTKKVNEELKPYGYNVGVKAGRRGRGGASSPIGIKLVTDNSDNYELLIEVSEDFENYLTNNELVSEASSSASSTLGQVEFIVDMEKASILGVDKKSVMNSISSIVRGKTIGSFRGTLDDHDVILMIDKFKDNLTPNDIENINLYIGGKTIKASSLISYEIKSTAPMIKREDGYIDVGVDADVKVSSDTTAVQNALNEFASEYNFPDGVSFRIGGENAENADLINTLIASIFIAFFFIFSILVFQFNSYAQPAIILYSVFMALSGVIIGLYLTGNPLSLPAGIGFISLMGIVVNDAIVYIDKINRNLSRGMDITAGIVNAGVSRLNPILVTTITTVAGILPIALQDPMWAGLGYTVSFGLVTGSLMTLYAVPTLYYSMMKKSK